MTSLSSFRVRLAKRFVVACLTLFALSGSRAVAQSQPSSASPTSGPAPATGTAGAQPNTPTPEQTPASDAAAKAAERKKRFEEAEKRLENSDSSHASNSPASDSKPGSPDDIAISPVLVNLLIGENQSFSLFDAAGHNLTAKAEWSLSNSYVADLQNNGVPTITSKDAGEVTVHSGNSLPTGTVRWQAPAVKGFKPVQIIQAVPTSSAPSTQPPQ